MGDNSLLSQLFIVLMLTLLNGFFAAAEVAMISINKKKIQVKANKGNKNAKLLIDILKEPSRFLSTIQVGITLAGFFSSASAAVGISDDLGRLLTSIGIPFGKNIAFILVTLILSYIILVFGELVPKRMALQNPDKFALFAIKPISIFAKFIKPFISFLSFSTNTVLSMFGIDKQGMQEKITLEEIKSIIEVGYEQDIIDSLEREIIYSIISFDHKIAQEIMTARTEVFMININTPAEEYLNQILEFQFSRIPIYDGKVDNIVGILYLKDYLFEAYRVGIDNIELSKVLRPAYFVPEHKSVNDLFLDLRSNRNHMAVLIDEYGGFSGIVTMEDLVEEIIGDIEDEYDEPDIQTLDPNTFYAKGRLSIKELNSALGSKIDENSTYFDTLGGLLIYLLGHIPTDRDKKTISYMGIDFNIKKIKNRRIKYVEITIKNTLS